MFPEENQSQGFEQQQPLQQPQQQPQYQPQQDFNQGQQFQQPVQQPQQQPDYQQYQQSDYQQPAQQQTDFEQGQQEYYQEQTQPDHQQQSDFYQPQQPNEQYQPSQFEQQPIDQYQQQAFQPQPVQEQVVTDAAKMDQEFDVWIDQQYPIPELPKIADVPEGDPNALQAFFDKYDEAQRQRNAIEQTRASVRAAKDEYLWSEVESKYPNLARAPKVKATLQRLYHGARQMGQNVTPLQVTNEYVQDLNSNYQQGYQTSNTQRVIRRSQPMPNGGQRRAPAQPTVTSQDMDSLNSNSNDVVDQAANIVAKMRAAGKGGFN